MKTKVAYIKVLIAIERDVLLIASSMIKNTMEIVRIKTNRRSQAEL